MTLGSLFAGIGGFDLGFERAGYEIKWQIDIDEFCLRHLDVRFPNVTRGRDVRSVEISCLQPVDVICGGFPCQPFSTSGKREGKSDDRYLWPEMLAVVRHLQPRFVVAENVAGIAHEFDWILEEVCDDLEASGYEVLPPLMVPACAFGAPHRRDRVWILAHSMRGDVSSQQKQQQKERAQVISGNAWWSAEPALARVVHGVPGRVAIDRAIGNAVVPQAAQWLAERIKEIAQ